MILAKKNNIELPDKDLALLKGIPTEKIQSVLRCLNADISHFKQGDVLASRLQASKRTRYLLDGEVSMIRYDALGIRSILGVFRTDSVISSELAPLFCEENSVDMIASAACTTLDIRFSQEVETCACCLKYINRIRSNLISSLVDMNIQLVKRLDTLANRSTREKLLAYLQEQSLLAKSQSFDISYKRQELADYLYIDRSALSRELSRMQQDGIIAYKKNSFVLSDSYLPSSSS